MTGEECYQLRSGAVHRGDLSAHSKFDGTHVIFTTPETPGHIHALSMEANGKRAAMFDLELFCGAMVAAARRWYHANEDNPLIEQNVRRLLRLCPNGLLPFVGGGPVVASGD
jgi:hypothetical protein